jgi:hypothetical protein
MSFGVFETFLKRALLTLAARRTEVEGCAGKIRGSIRVGVRRSESFLSNREMHMLTRSARHMVAQQVSVVSGRSFLFVGSQETIQT